MSFTASPTNTLTRAADLPQKLAATLRAGHSGAVTRAKMVPDLSYGRYAGPAPYSARKAAVVLLLFRRDGKWHIPLTQRPLSLTHHGGQISLPGGAVERGETSAEAGIRELREELGLGAPVEVIGRLEDCYVFASNFLVTPWLATSPEVPNWCPDEREVDHVIELPLEILLDAAAIGQLTVERGPRVFHAPCIRVGNARVWGVTCMILGELAGLLRHILETER
jgi:8-oxo-dGTP pyrophosphatase MutT (NUDIX family)